MATEVVGSVVPPPPAAADNSGEERMVVETTISQVVSEPHVRTASGGGDAVMVSAEQGISPPPSARDHEGVTPVATKTPALVTPRRAWMWRKHRRLAPGLPSTSGLLISMPLNSRAMIGTSMRPCWSACWPTQWSWRSWPPEAAMSGIASFAEAVTAASGEPVSDTVVVGQPVPS